MSTAEYDVKVDSWKSGRDHRISANIPYGGEIIGTLYDDWGKVPGIPGDGKKVIGVDSFRVPVEMRGRGMGTVLMREFLNEGLGMGANVQIGYVAHKGGITVVKKLIGPSVIRFYDQKNGYSPINITPEQLVAGDDFKYCFVADLTKVKFPLK